MASDDAVFWSFTIIGSVIYIFWLVLWAQFGFLGLTNEPWDCWASEKIQQPSLTPLDNTYINMAARFRHLCKYVFFVSSIMPFALCCEPLKYLLFVLPFAFKVWFILLGMWTFGH